MTGTPPSSRNPAPAWADYVSVVGGPLNIGNSLGIMTANDLRAFRAKITRGGTLTTVACFVGVSLGNLSIAVYDVGEAADDTCTRLATSGAVAVGPANSWQSFEPGITVRAGQELMLAVSVDNATASFAMVPNAGNAAYVQLPSGYLDSPAVAGRLAGRVATAHPAPATIADASWVNTSNVPVVIARIV